MVGVCAKRFDTHIVECQYFTPQAVFQIHLLFIYVHSITVIVTSNETHSEDGNQWDFNFKLMFLLLQFDTHITIS
jgi:hypothetical protein